MESPGMEFGERKDALDEVSDEELIRLVLKGEKDEFRHLVRRHQDRVYAMIRRSVGDEATARELAQETFLKAFLNLKSFRFESAFSTWLIRIALNQSHSYFSSRRFKERSRTTELDETWHAAQQTTDGDPMVRKQELEQLRTAIGDLKPKLRDVVVLCSLEGRSYEETATLLEVPIGTVRSRLNKARLELRKSLKGEG